MNNAKIILMIIVFLSVSVTLYFISSMKSSATGMAVLEAASEDKPQCASNAQCLQGDVCCNVDGKNFCTNLLQCKQLYNLSQTRDNGMLTKHPFAFLVSAMLITVSAWFLFIKRMEW